MDEQKVARKPECSRNEECKRSYDESAFASPSPLQRSASQKKETPVFSESSNPRISVLQLASHFSRLSQAPKGLMKRFSRSSSHHVRSKISDLERSFTLCKKPSFTSVPSSHSIQINSSQTESHKESSNQTPSQTQPTKTNSSSLLSSSFFCFPKNSYDVCKSQKNDSKQTPPEMNSERSKIESLITFSTKELKRKLSTRFDTFYSPQKTVPVLSKPKLFQAQASPPSIPQTLPRTSSLNQKTLQPPSKPPQLSTSKTSFVSEVSPPSSVEDSVHPSPSIKIQSEYEKLELKRKLKERIKEKVIEMSSADSFLPLLDQGFEGRFSFNTDLPPAPGYFKKSVRDYPSRAYINVVVACSSFIMDDPHLNK